MRYPHRYNLCTIIISYRSQANHPGSPFKAEGKPLTIHSFGRATDIYHCHSKQYVNTILSELPADRLHLSTPVTSILSRESSLQIKLTTADGKVELFDHVIMACHTDDTLRILNEGGGVSEEEKRILGGFRWSRNEVVVHSDENVSTDVALGPVLKLTDALLVYSS